MRIRHDPQRIGQVVANLVGNALKFTPRGGQVTVSVRPTTDGAEIEVADTGVGIGTEELPRIFERFYRGSRANEARGSGSGLGLAIVKSIVDMHVGRVSVESVIGGGTTFTVSLPADPRTATPLEASGDPAADAEPADIAARRRPAPRWPRRVHRRLRTPHGRGPVRGYGEFFTDAGAQPEQPSVTLRTTPGAPGSSATAFEALSRETMTGPELPPSGEPPLTPASPPSWAATPPTPPPAPPRRAAPDLPAAAEPYAGQPAGAYSPALLPTADWARSSGQGGAAGTPEAWFEPVPAQPSNSSGTRPASRNRGAGAARSWRPRSCRPSSRRAARSSP